MTFLIGILPLLWIAIVLTGVGFVFRRILRIENGLDAVLLMGTTSVLAVLMLVIGFQIIILINP